MNLNSAFNLLKLFLSHILSCSLNTGFTSFKNFGRRVSIDHLECGIRNKT